MRHYIFQLRDGRFALLYHRPETRACLLPMELVGASLAGAADLLRSLGLDVHLADRDQAPWGRLMFDGRQSGQDMPSEQVLELRTNLLVRRRRVA